MARKSRLATRGSRLRLAGSHISHSHGCVSMCFNSLYNDQINARALIGQSAMVYCASKLMEKCASSQLLHSKNYYTRTIVTLEEFVNHEPATRDLRILLVFCRHPTWFISLYNIDKTHV